MSEIARRILRSSGHLCIAVITLAVGMSACTASGDNQRAPEAIAPGVDPDIHQFGRLIGRWHIAQQIRQQDGSWLDVGAAHWQFEYVLGGHAIQDQWVQPPLSTTLKPGQERQFGTNLRIYDPENDLWRIVWASSDQSDFTEYTASSNDRGELVMIGADQERPGTTQRITYYDISASDWKWKMEFSTDDKQWVEVARLVATRMPSIP